MTKMRKLVISAGVTALMKIILIIIALYEAFNGKYAEACFYLLLSRF